MGMIACYMEADDSLIEEMENKVTEEIMESIEELGEEGELEVNDIDSALAAFSPLDFANNRVYPAIWKESEKEGLRKELL